MTVSDASQPVMNLWIPADAAGDSSNDPQHPPHTRIAASGEGGGVTIARITTPEGRVYRMDYENEKLVRIVNVSRPRNRAEPLHKTLWTKGEPVGVTAKRVMRHLPTEVSK